MAAAAAGLEGGNATKNTARQTSGIKGATTRISAPTAVVTLARHGTPVPVTRVAAVSIVALTAITSVRRRGGVTIY